MTRNNKDRNASYIDIEGVTFKQHIIDVIMGEEGAEDLKEGWLPIAEALQYPERFPLLLDDILDVEKSKELRRALIRVQIDSQLRIDEDLDFYKKQLFTAESIEILLFRRLKLKPKGKKRKKKKSKEDESDEEDVPEEEEPVEEGEEIEEDEEVDEESDDEDEGGEDEDDEEDEEDTDEENEDEDDEDGNDEEDEEDTDDGDDEDTDDGDDEDDEEEEGD